MAIFQLTNLKVINYSYSDYYKEGIWKVSFFCINTVRVYIIVSIMLYFILFSSFEARDEGLCQPRWEYGVRFMYFVIVDLCL